MQPLNDIQSLLVSDGIANVPNLYTPQDIERINCRSDEIFEHMGHESRSYIKIDVMNEINVLNLIFNQATLDLLFSIVADAVLYHCHIYEICGGNNKSHIFSESLQGFHTDVDSEWHPDDPSHVSLFVYLTDVQAESGPFEFIPKPPTQWLTGSTPVATMTGPRGAAFVWNRSFYHRAAPNRSNVRRRLLKLSIQHNSAPSAHINDQAFQAVRAASVTEGDPRLATLFGEHQGGHTPAFSAPAMPIIERVHSTRMLNLSSAELTKVNIKAGIKRIKRSVLPKLNPEMAAYD